MAKLNIVLVEPEIPPNTGNIARLCAATNSALHLVHPLGFSTDDKHLKRAGLDYWQYVEIHHHENLEAFLRQVDQKELLLLYSTKGAKPYTYARIKDGAYLLFGKETQGLPRWLLERFSSRSYFIPMWGRTRSLNLSTAVGIVAYDAYRQLTNNFCTLES